jgi:hypothetical protein
MAVLMAKKKKKDDKLRGSQRSLTSPGIVSVSRRYDLEITENPIRDPRISRELIELNQWCYEVVHALDMAASDTFASDDGDDQGWVVAKTLDDEETPVNPEVFAIAEDIRLRKQNFSTYMIGGDRLKKALRWALGKGECFLELGIEREGLSANKSKDFGVAKTLYLPTFEMFRKETDQGELIGFEQRKYVSESDPDYFFEPYKICHIRHEPDFLYGRSLWLASLDAWADVKQAFDNLIRASNDLGVSPTLHIMPGISTEQERIYERELEIRRKSGIITDHILSYPGQDIRKMTNFNSDLTGLVDTLLQCRYKLIIPGFPTYFFPGLESKGGTKELSRSPDRRYSRMRYGWCQLLSGAIKQVIDTEIILRKGLDFYAENARNKYRILWPEWSESIDGMSGGEVEDTDSDLTDEETNKQPVKKININQND